MPKRNCRFLRDDHAKCDNTRVEHNYGSSKHYSTVAQTMCIFLDTAPSATLTLSGVIRPRKRIHSTAV